MLPKIILFLLIGWESSVFGQNLILKIEGTFTGKNLYFQNPMDDDGFGYCASKVYLNGKLILDSIDLNRGVFEINLKGQNLELEQNIKIEIAHKYGCLPKIMSNGCLPNCKKVNFESVFIDLNKNIRWNVTDQTTYSFFIEQYIWNKWTQIGEVSSKDSISKQEYSFHLASLHSGINKFRISQMDVLGIKTSSNEISVEIDKLPIQFEKNQETRAIEFSEETRFEIFDKTGSIVKKGISKSIDCSNLIDGIYYMNYDNTATKLVFKENKKRKKK